MMEDEARRRQGAFYTPAIWVAEAHKLVSEVLGPSWKDECIVWDPAAGVGNLTRDYTFKDLIISTLDCADVQVIKDQAYNPGAEVFQYDFLMGSRGESLFFVDEQANEVPNSVLARLKKAASEGKRLVWLMNPPYGTAGETSTKKTGGSKLGIALTETNCLMKAAKLGACSQQLYAQFMFRCAVVARELGFKEYTVAQFSIPTFMCSGSYRPFRQWWYDKHAYRGGFLFQASHFADVSGRWGVSFTVWNGGANPGKTEGATTQPMVLKDVEDFTVVGMGTKGIYNSDGREASRWVREPGNGEDAPQFSSGLIITDRITAQGSLATGALGYMVLFGNNLRDANDGTYSLSSTSSRGNGYSYFPTNFRRCIALYAARKLVGETWENQKDEYLSPQEDAPGYEQWVDDAHIFALIHRHNNCTSMRNVPYKGKLWTIHNHFFWRTHQAALQALDQPKTPTLYADCKAHPSKDVFGNPVVSTPDPYLASVLPSLNLSVEGREVLNKLDALWLKSLPDREAYAAGKPELHLMAWDASLYQLKNLFRDLYPTEWKDLQVSFKKLGDKLRPGVYEYGFLRR